MTTYKIFFRKEDIGFYNEFKKEIEEYLERIEQPYKSHKEINEESKYETIKKLEEDPKYKHLFNQKKYNKIVTNQHSKQKTQQQKT